MATVDQFDRRYPTSRIPDFSRDRYSFYLLPDEKFEALLIQYLERRQQSRPKTPLAEDKA